MFKQPSREGLIQHGRTKGMHRCKGESRPHEGKVRPTSGGANPQEYIEGR